MRPVVLTFAGTVLDWTRGLRERAGRRRRRPRRSRGRLVGCWPPFADSAERDVSVRLSPAWWHVSAYGDYDLATARALGLTCVFVERPHRRPGPHHLAVPDLRALADRLRAEPAAKDDRGCAVSRLPGAEAPRNAPALRGVTREVWNPRNLPPFPGVAAGGGNVWR